MGKEIRQALGNNGQTRLTVPPLEAKLRGQILPGGGINCRGALMVRPEENPVFTGMLAGGMGLANLTGV
jgi:hypothetical protein